MGWGIANVTIVAKPQVFANFSFNNNLMTTGDGGFHQVLPGNKQPGCATTSAAGMVGTLNGCMGDTWTAAGNVFANTSTKVAESAARKSTSCAQFRGTKLRLAGPHELQ